MSKPKMWNGRWNGHKPVPGPGILHGYAWSPNDGLWRKEIVVPGSGPRTLAREVLVRDGQGTLLRVERPGRRRPAREAVAA